MPSCWALGLQKEKRIQQYSHTSWGGSRYDGKLPSHKVGRCGCLGRKSRDGVCVRYGLVVVGSVCAKANVAFYPKEFHVVETKTSGW